MRPAPVLRSQYVSLTIVAIIANMAIMKTRQTTSKATSHRQKDMNRALVGHRAKASYSATEAKNEFGRLLEQAIHGTTVVITKHDSPRAVLISIDKFEELQNAPVSRLNTLTEQFDA